MKIIYKIIFLSFMISVVVIIVSTGIIGQLLSNNQLETIEDRLSKELYHINFYLDEYVQRIEEDITLLLTNPQFEFPTPTGFTSYLNATSEEFKYDPKGIEKTIIDIFNRFRIAHPKVQFLYLGLNDGAFVMNTPLMPVDGSPDQRFNYDPRTRPWYENALRDKEHIVITDPYIAPEGTSFFLTVSKTVFDAEGNVSGVIGIDTSIEDLADYLREIWLGSSGIFGLAQDNTSITVDAEGNIALLDKGIKDHKWLSELKGKSRSIEEVSLEGIDYYSIYLEATKLPWIIYFLIPTEKIDTIVNLQVIPLLILLATVIVILTLMIIGVINFSIVRPLNKLNIATKQVIDSEDLEVSVSVHSRDEIGSMANSFNLMIKDLRHHHEHMEELVNERTIELSKFNKAVEQSPISIVITNLKGSIEYVNPKFVDITGYKTEEAIGKNPRILNSGMVSKKFFSDMWKTITAGKEWHGEFSNKKKNGSIFWESASISPLKNEDGEITHFVALKEDITERKEAEEALKESVALNERNQARLNALVSALPDITIIFDEYGRYREIFQRDDNLEISGTLPEYEDLNKLVGKTIHEVFPPDIAEKIQKAITAAIETNITQKTEYVIPSTLGPRWFDARFSSMSISSKKIREVVLVARDITDLKQLNEELAAAKETAIDATKAKGDFLANMSHEIRTPMNAIMGMTHLAMQTDLTPKQEDYLKKTHGSATSLLGLINDILDFSKIEAGKMDMESIDFLLDDVMDNVSTLISIKAEDKGLGLVFKTPSSVPRFLIGDSLRLGQILINLANNAVKFTEKGEITIDTVLIEETQEKFTLQFAVRDTGIGLTKVQIGKLFKSFSQADSSTTRKFGGTGLGLTISKRLVEMMNGKIWIESEPGKGSSFIFTAVFGHGNEAEITARSSQKGFDQESLKSIQGSHILLVEDNEINQQVAQEMLENAGFEIDIAENGQIAVEAVEKKSYDLVLMDIQMPVMDGYEATKEIRNKLQFKDLPILAMSASAMIQDRNNSLKSGMNDHVAKPIDLQQLFIALLKWIKPGERKLPEGFKAKGKKSSEEIIIPKIEGIDIEEGLAHVGGNKKLYLNLLSKFRDGYGNTVTEIKESLKKGDREAAVRGAHTVKGVAGNIGAKEMQQAAAVVEGALKKETEKDEQLKKLDELLFVLIGNLKQADLDSKAETEGEESKSKIDPEMLKELLEELKLILEKRKPKPAKEIIEKIGGYKLSDDFKTEFEKLSLCVRKYDFKGALKSNKMMLEKRMNDFGSN